MSDDELIDHLLQVLLKYGRHKPDCQMYGLHHCTCGWYGEYLRRDDLIRKRAALTVPETEVKS